MNMTDDLLHNICVHLTSDCSIIYQDQSRQDPGPCLYYASLVTDET